MGGIQKFEQKLESLISGTFARAFRSAVQPVEFAAALQREVDNNAQILSRERRLVPNDFEFELSDSDFQRLNLGEEADSINLSRELIGQLRRYAEEQGYVFPGPIALAFDAAEDLGTGRFRLRSRSQAAVSNGYTAPEEAAHLQAAPTRAVLVINGTEHPLQPPGLTVGRSSEADIRITDPGVSRRHVDFRVSAGAGDAVDVIVVDLGSTNGMLVNGRKMTQARLFDGSVVRIGTTDMTVRLVEEHV